MFDKQKRKPLSPAMSAVAVLSCVVGFIAFTFGVDLLLDATLHIPYFDSNYSNNYPDDPGSYILFFILGIVFFPGALRRYRKAQQKEAKVAWYHRWDLILCLYGSLSGPFCILSLWLRWANFMTTNDMKLSSPLLFGYKTWWIMSSVDLVLSISWVALMGWMIYLGIKMRKQKEIDSSVP